MSKATEIYYTECCALCRHFEEGMLGCLYSVSEFKLEAE